MINTNVQLQQFQKDVVLQNFNIYLTKKLKQIFTLKQQNDYQVNQKIKEMNLIKIYIHLLAQMILLLLGDRIIDFPSHVFVLLNLQTDPHFIQMFQSIQLSAKQSHTRWTNLSTMPLPSYLFSFLIISSCNQKLKKG
ncbi:unnamed protein product [Paramecium octaurelia]|uniref:Uncharacterized protein n=1 Tax=Paramecium octaurelia TaxID=43137 RepID=A0A8S1WM71_PAROT|nr:unnamed protein product [Paramecium octaurelia]